MSVKKQATACPHVSVVPVDALTGEHVAWLCTDCDAQLERLPPAAQDGYIGQLEGLITVYERTSDAERRKMIRGEVEKLHDIINRDYRSQ